LTRTNQKGQRKLPLGLVLPNFFIDFLCDLGVLRGEEFWGSIKHIGIIRYELCVDDV
jgi:hypothetical protein